MLWTVILEGEKIVGTPADPDAPGILPRKSMPLNSVFIYNLKMY